MKSPNDYRRVDVVALARIINPGAWKHIPEGMDMVTPHDYYVCSDSITLAANILMAGYRDCRIV